MPVGSPRPTAGRRPGGRNKATEQKLIAAELAIREAQAREQGKPGPKLAKEVLREFMELFAGMAGVYQPMPPGVNTPPGRSPDEDKFLRYAELARDTAKMLAPYESPTFKALAVTMGPVDTPKQLEPKTIEGKIVELNDPVAITRLYQKVVNGR